MKKITVASRLRTLRVWLNNIPIQDTVERRMATLLQVVLIGFIAVLLVAAALNLIIAPEISWQIVLIRSFIFILILGIPLALIRRGYFRSSVWIIIAIFFLLEAYAVTMASLREIAETLSFFTLAIMLAGLLVNRRALALTFVLSAAAVGFGAFQEQNAGLGEDGIVVAINFVLLNGLMSLFLDRFGIVLRAALNDALERENELQKEISNRKQAEETLRASEERYRKLIDHARDVIFTISTDGRITSLSPSFEIFTGWSRAEWLGRAFDELVAEDDRLRARDQFDQILRGETLRALRLRIHTRSGEMSVVEMNISPQFKDGHVVGLLGIARDMTEEQRAEDALRASEKRFRALIENSSDAISLISAEGTILYESPSVHRVLGYSPEELVGRNVFELLHPDDLPEIMPVFSQILQQPDQVVTAGARYRHKDGSWLWIEGTGKNLIAEPGVQAIVVNYRDITAREQAEDALRKAQEDLERLVQERTAALSQANTLLQTMLDYTPDHIFFKDLQSRFIRNSKSQADMLGLSDPAQVIGKTDFDFFPHAQRAYEEEQSIIRSGQPMTDFEEHVIWPDGRETWVATTKVPLRDQEGRIIGTFGVARDITDRKRAEEALHKAKDELEIRVVERTAELKQTNEQLRLELTAREQAEAKLREAEAKYRSLVEHIPAITYTAALDDPKTRLYVSPQIEALLGVSPAEYLADADLWRRLIHPQDRERVLAEAARFYAGGESFVSEYRTLTRDGRALWFHDEAVIVSDETGQPRFIQGVKVDITERKQTEEELRQRESILEAAANNAQLLLKAPDWRTEINTVLEGLGQTINVSHAYLFENHKGPNGETVTSIRFEWDAPFCSSDLDNPVFKNVPLSVVGFEIWYDAMSRRQPYIGDKRIFTPAEVDFYSSRGIKALLEMPIYINDQWWGIIGFDDIVQEREWSKAEADAMVIAANILGAAIQRGQTEEDREKLIAELTAKNAELESFTYTVSHDLKSPLVTMKGFLGYLEQDAMTGNVERLKGDTKRIASAVEKMQELLNDLLELSRIGRFVNPSETIPFEELIREATDIVQGRLDMRRVTVQAQPDLPAVYGDRQRLIEVLQNLIDNAVKNMGEQPEPRVEIGQRGEEEGKSIFFVRDNGVGIAPEYHERVFGLFNKLDARSEGTGIGLALVKRIIEFHGGGIWVESEAGKGSTFCFTLPVT